MALQERVITNMFLVSIENTLITTISLTHIQKHMHTAKRTDIHETAVTIKCCQTAEKRGLAGADST